MREGAGHERTGTERERRRVGKREGEKTERKRMMWERG